jgi:hypothetical protein
VIDRAAVETEADVKIELMRFAKPPGAAAVEKLSGSLMVIVVS